MGGAFPEGAPTRPFRGRIPTVIEIRRRRGASLPDAESVAESVDRLLDLAEELRERAGDTLRATAEAATAGPERPPAGRAIDVVRSARRAAFVATTGRREALRRGRLDLAISVTALLGFAAVFAIVRANRSMEFDIGITMRVQRERHALLARLMELVSWPGFPPQSRVIPSFTSMALWILGFPLEALFVLGAWTTGAVSERIKAFMRRPRPEHEGIRVAVGPLGGSSFPSGHVITYVGVYGFLAYLAHTLIRPARIRRPIAAACAGLIAMVGPSRIYQGHHWPTDVLASYFLGTTYLVGLMALYRRIKGSARLVHGKPRRPRGPAQLPGRRGRPR
jgi:undecaprenyl-diphosphatase